MAITKETSIDGIVIDRNGNMTVTFRHDFVENGEIAGQGSERASFAPNDDMSDEDEYLQALMDAVNKEFSE